MNSFNFAWEESITLPTIKHGGGGTDNQSNSFAVIVMVF
jgi:hypothetical protein